MNVLILSKSAMKSLAGGFNSLMRGIKVDKRPDMQTSTVEHQFRNPSVVSGTPMNTLRAARILRWLGSIHLVLGLSGVSKVGNLIVRLVSVYVINIYFGPNTIFHRPRHSMCDNSKPKNVAMKISPAILGGESFFASIFSVPYSAILCGRLLPIDKHLWSSWLPKQFSAFSIVIKNVVQKCGIKYFAGGHERFHRLCGPVEGATSRPVFYRTIVQVRQA